MRNERVPTQLSIALAPIFALAAVALMVLMIPSGTAVSVSSATSSGTYAGTYSLGEPTPYLPTNLSVSNISLANPNPALTYPVLVGGQVGWMQATHVELDPRTPNPVSYSPSKLVVPGVWQGAPLPGPASACDNIPVTSRCYDATNTALWVLSHGAYGSTGGGTATLANGTSAYGQPLVTIRANNSNNGGLAKHGQYALAQLALPASSLPSLSISSDYVDAIYSLSSNDCPALASTGEPGAYPCDATFGLGNATSAQQAYPAVNVTTRDPTALSTAGIYGSSAPIYDVIPGLALTGGNEYVDTQTIADAAGVNETVMVSVPLSDMTGPGVGLNVSSTASPCGPGTAIAGCTGQVNLTFRVQTGNGGAYQNVTMTIWGIAITTSPLTLGATYVRGVWLDTYTTYNVWDNTTSAREVVGQYGAPSNLTDFAPSWGASGWLPEYSVSESWVAPSTMLTNETVTYYTSSAGGGQAAYSFPLAFPQAASLQYGETRVYDTTADVPGVNYTIAQACETQTQCLGVNPYNDAPNLATLHGGHNVQIRDEATICSPPLGDPNGCYNVDPYNAVVNETLTYSPAAWCSLGQCVPPPPPPATHNNTSTTGTSPGGPLGGTVSVTGEWILIGLLALVAVIALVAWASYEGGERKMRGEGGRRGTLNGPSLRRSRLGVGGRTRQAYEHDAAGLGWFVVAAVLGLAAFYWVSSSGVLGFALSQVAAAAIVIVLMAVMVVLLVVWEGTKTVS